MNYEAIQKIISYSRYDLRTVEIWYQMCWYLDENV